MDKLSQFPVALLSALVFILGLFAIYIGKDLIETLKACTKSIIELSVEMKGLKDDFKGMDADIKTLRSHFFEKEQGKCRTKSSKRSKKGLKIETLTLTP